jgi:hypothetical protein
MSHTITATAQRLTVTTGTLNAGLVGFVCVLVLVVIVSVCPAP